jgi:hypothetical protein
MMKALKFLHIFSQDRFHVGCAASLHKKIIKNSKPFIKSEINTSNKHTTNAPYFPNNLYPKQINTNPTTAIVHTFENRK